MNRRFSNNKLFGGVVNYRRGVLRVRLLLDANKKRLTLFTPSNPQGEVYSDLPKDGLFYPALQNKTKINAPAVLRVGYRFELPIPANRQLIGTLSYSSEEEDNDTPLEMVSS